MGNIQGGNVGFQRDIFHGHAGISDVFSIIQAQNLFQQLGADVKLMSSIIAVAVYIFVMASVAEIKLQDSVISSAVGTIRIVAAAVATILPVFIHWPKMGWIIFVIWMSFFVWLSYDTYPEFYHSLYQAAIWALDKLKSLLKAMKRYVTGEKEEPEGTA